ncbi:RNA-directed DNA polymerase-like protein [Cucumis melo var. makuwa]|uniref:RNA-directed DNA polymerase-like protein n=1 Tax=Cucumis melo var. makuwa TaxID=1194695 RepID=A0A5D3DHJ1_CUCMM|nr:RNA-directed DNA polymerase-like protein [Cucumis melo var. makuwa]
MINLGGWNGPVDFMVLKMDDFNVVFGMEFLLEHHVIPMPSAKCLMITGSFLTMYEQTFVSLTGETIPKDTLCMLKKCGGVMPKIWPKSLLSQGMIDHEIGSLPEAKASVKNAYRTTPPETKEEEGPETTYVTGHGAFEFPIVPFSLTNAIATFCLPMNQVFQDYIDNSVVVYLDEIVARNPIRVEPKEHLQKVAFDEARHDRGVILGVVDTTKPFEVETERFSRNNPQVYRFAEEWKQMIDIARACLEKASRQMEKRASQKRCPLSFQQRIKFPITGATMLYDYLST